MDQVPKALRGGVEYGCRYESVRHKLASPTLGNYDGVLPFHLVTQTTILNLDDFTQPGVYSFLSNVNFCNLPLGESQTDNSSQTLYTLLVLNERAKSTQILSTTRSGLRVWMRSEAPWGDFTNWYTIPITEVIGDTNRTVTITASALGTITMTNGSNAPVTSFKAGSRVKLTAVGKIVDGVQYYPTGWTVANGAQIRIPKGTYSNGDTTLATIFTMINADITISAAFATGVQS